MAKEIGADRLGDFYTNGKVRKRREWRGLKDTVYDYKCWLGIVITRIRSFLWYYYIRFTCSIISWYASRSSRCLLLRRP